ncbi:MAG: carotenoid biosynthesis protein, partial [Halobacteria archaeon]|nr:carotenoid biosynthesis protein [Halobacteria archaeon]
VPATLPIFWVPILVNSLLLAAVFVYPRVKSVVVTAAAGAGFVVLLDIVLDPGAVALGFWSWENPGVFYGVPLVNFAGWALSASVG